MSGYGRIKVEGDRPTSLYVVTNGVWHKVYSTLGAARGMRTHEKRHGYPEGQTVRIYKIIVDANLEEIDPHVA